MNMLQRNSKKQGDVGLGAAIGWFAGQGHTVCIPLTDSQEFDLIVVIDDVLFRVQVKTTRFFRNNQYEVSLITKGGNRSGAGKNKKLDITKIEYLFILTAENTKYLIPISGLRGTSYIKLTPYYDKFKI